MPKGKIDKKPQYIYLIDEARIQYVYLIYNFIALSVNRAGFWSAMASNLTNQSRNVLSKKVMVKHEVIFIFHIHIMNNYKFLIGKKLGQIVIRSWYLILLSFLVYLRVFFKSQLA